MPYHGNATDQMTEREWKRAWIERVQRSHPGTRQQHANAEGDAELRQWEWQRLRPNDHLRRKAMVGRAQ